MAAKSVTTDRQIAKITTTDKRQDFKVKTNASSQYNCLGLVLRVYPTGIKSFTTRITDNQGKRRVITLGSHNTGMTISEAAKLKTEYKTKGVDETQASSQLAELAQQKAEQLAKIEAQKGSTLDDWLPAFYKSRVNSKKSADVIKSIFTRFINTPDFIKGKPLADVTQSEIHDRITNIRHSNGADPARKTYIYLNIFLKWSASSGKLKSNPMAAIDPKDFDFKPNGDDGRERHLSRDEVPILFQAIDNAPRMQERTRIAFRILLMTGVRSGELMKASWQDVDLDKALWVLPPENTKTDQRLVIPLPYQATALFRQLKTITATGSPLVMGGISPKAVTKALRRLQQPDSKGVTALQLDEPLTLHDFRRSFTTFLNGMGVLPHVVEKMVNHKLQGIAKKYNRAQLLIERKAAAQLLADALDDPLELLPVNEL